MLFSPLFICIGYLFYTGAAATPSNFQQSHLFLSSNNRTLYLLQPAYNAENGTTGNPQLFAFPVNQMTGVEVSGNAGALIPKFSETNNGPFTGSGPAVPFSVINIDGRSVVMVGKPGCAWGAESWELADEGTPGWVKLAGNLNIRISDGARAFYAQKSRKVYSLNPPCEATEGNETGESSNRLSVFSITIDEIFGRAAVSVPHSSKSSARVTRRSIPGDNWIPYRGFSVSKLPGAITTQSGGETIERENWLLMGGYQDEKIGMELGTAVVFSTPDHSWKNKTIALQNLPTTIQSPSGHTALQSKDGSKIMFFGGWIGNSDSVEGNPQQLKAPEKGIMILDVSGPEWKWSSVEATFPPKGPGENNAQPGVFGHSAIMLDDDIAVISGGYRFGQSSPSLPSTNLVQRSMVNSNPQVYIFNTTSFKYLSEYNLFNPHVPGDHPTATKGTSPTETPKGNPDPNLNGRNDNPWGKSHIRRVVIAIATVVGLVALLGAISFALWFTRRVSEEKKQIIENSGRLNGFGTEDTKKRTLKKRFIGKSPKHGLISGVIATPATDSSESLNRKNNSPFSFEEGVVDVISVRGFPVYHPPRPLRRIFHHRGVDHVTIRSISPIIEGDEEPDYYIRRKNIDDYESETTLVIKGNGAVSTGEGFLAGSSTEEGIRASQADGLHRIPSKSLETMAKSLVRHFSNRSGRYFMPFQTDEYGRIEEDERTSPELDRLDRMTEPQVSRERQGGDWGRLVKQYRKHVEFVRGLSGDTTFWSGEGRDEDGEIYSTQEISDRASSGPFSARPAATPPLRSSSSLSARIKGLVPSPPPTLLHSTTTVSALVALTPSPCSSSIALTPSRCGSCSEPSRPSSNQSPDDSGTFHYGRWKKTPQSSDPYAQTVTKYQGQDRIIRPSSTYSVNSSGSCTCSNGSSSSAPSSSHGFTMGHPTRPLTAAGPRNNGINLNGVSSASENSISTITESNAFSSQRVRHDRASAGENKYARNRPPTTPIRDLPSPPLKASSVDHAVENSSTGSGYHIHRALMKPNSSQMQGYRRS